jgi:RNA polymerase sigma-70 factor (ECF subfamily)
MPLTPSEEKILELFREPSTRERGFEMLVQEFQRPVYWLIRRMVVDHDDANDLTQDTFVSVWQHLDDFRGESKLFTWIYKIAYNEALGFIKRQKKRAQVPLESVERKLSSQLEEDHYFQGDEIQKKLQMAIQSLPPQQRLIFTMKYYNELKYEDMAKILGLTTGALKASFHHAVKKIEKFVTNG